MHYRSDGFSGQARIKAEQGNYSSALSALDKGLQSPDLIENDADRGQRWLDRAYISCRMEQFIVPLFRSAVITLHGPDFAPNGHENSQQFSVCATMRSLAR